MTMKRPRDDGDLIREMASNLIQRHGPKAPRVALKHEETARARGHHTDADAWLQIAGAATEMLRGTPFMGEVLTFLRRLR
jgi:hypothetical protein